MSERKELYGSPAKCQYTQWIMNKRAQMFLIDKRVMNELDSDPTLTILKSSRLCWDKHWSDSNRVMKPE